MPIYRRGTTSLYSGWSHNTYCTTIMYVLVFKMNLNLEKEVTQKISTELKLEGKSDKTIKTYINYNINLLKFSKKDYKDITTDDIKEYLAHLISERGNDPATIALVRSSLSYFYKRILKKDILLDIRTPKKRRKLPEILSKNEVKRMIECASKLNDKLYIEFMYSAGLRVEECAKLHWTDIDLVEKIGRLKNGKGGKDRLFIISDKLISSLQGLNQNSEYIFPSRSGRVTTRTIQRSIAKSAKLAGILKRVYPHLLRHSFATHLIESGVDIRIIQELLAHSSLETTQFYTHVSTKMIKSVKSPLDDM